MDLDETAKPREGVDANAKTLARSWLELSAYSGVLLFLSIALGRVGDRAYCPPGYLACWSTGERAYIVPLVMMPVILAWLFVMSPHPSARRAFIARWLARLLVGGALICMVYLHWIDVQTYVAVTENGFTLHLRRHETAVRYDWEDATRVHAFCRAGKFPPVDLRFSMRDGGTAVITHKLWVRLIARHPSIAVRTEKLPYTVEDVPRCRRFNDYVPVDGLNHYPKWFID